MVGAAEAGNGKRGDAGRELERGRRGEKGGGAPGAGLDRVNVEDEEYLAREIVVELLKPSAVRIAYLLPGVANSPHLTVIP